MDMQVSRVIRGVFLSVGRTLVVAGVLLFAVLLWLFLQHPDSNEAPVADGSEEVNPSPEPDAPDSPPQSAGEDGPEGPSGLRELNPKPEPEGQEPDSPPQSAGEKAPPGPSVAPGIRIIVGPEERALGEELRKKLSLAFGVSVEVGSSSVNSRIAIDLHAMRSNSSIMVQGVELPTCTVEVFSELSSGGREKSSVSQLARAPTCERAADRAIDLLGDKLTQDIASLNPFDGG